MPQITLKDYLISQPSFPQVSESDPFYLELANALYDGMASHAYAKGMPQALIKKIALTLTDYMQDISADAGIWRSFIVANRKLYGFTVPFYEISKDYIDFELNREDVRFLVWYVISMLWDEKRLLNPRDPNLIEFSDFCFSVLDSKYEEAPIVHNFNIAAGLDFKDPEDKDKIFSLGNWLFLHSYLMTPAFALTLKELGSEIPYDDPDFGAKLNARLEDAMINDTTGPLALFIPEWVYLIIKGNLPDEMPHPGSEPHKFYKAFVDYTGGKEIMFFDSYEKLNAFFIEALGWNKDEEHLPQVKGQHDFILMVTPEKGMLMAVNVARCIKAPDNQLYDSAFAEKNAFSLLTERGRCPGDLLVKVLENGWLPDAHFPGSDDYGFVGKYADFIARLYLQIYYRGD